SLRAERPRQLLCQCHERNRQLAQRDFAGRDSRSIVPIAANKCEVLLCPGNFIARSSACDLQGEISSVINLFKAGEECREVSIAGSQRNGPTVQDTVLNVDAADSVPVSCELVGRRISQRSAISR